MFPQLGVRGLLLWVLLLTLSIVPGVNAQVQSTPLSVDSFESVISLNDYILKSAATESQIASFETEPETFIFNELVPSLSSFAGSSESGFDWQQNRGSEVLVESDSGSSWLYLELTNSQSMNKEYLLAIEKSQASSWAILDSKNNIQLNLASLEKPLLGRIVFDKAYVIPLILPPNETKRIVITNYALTPSNSVNLNLWEPESFREARTKGYLTQGAYFGFLLFFFLFCLLFSILQKQIVYLYAAAFQLSIGCLIALSTGLAEIIVFPNNAGVVLSVYIAVIQLAGVFSSLFSLKILDINSVNPRLYRFWRGYIWAGFLLVPSAAYAVLPETFLIGRDLIFIVGVIVLFIGQYLYVYGFYLCWKRSKITLLWFFIVVFQYWVVSASQLLDSSGLGSGFDFRALLQLFTVIEASVLFILLSFFYRQEQERAVVAQRETLSSLQIANDVQRSKAEFISMAGHDLRQPLETIKFYLSSLRNNADQKVNDAVEKMTSNLLELSKLLESLVNLSRGNAPSDTLEKDALPLADIFKQLTQEILPFAQQKGVLLEVEPTTLLVVSNQVGLTQIIRNLLNNSLKFTHSGFIRMEAEASAAGVVIRVEDSGIGIPENLQTRIFEEFYRVPSEGNQAIAGSGIGLSIVARLAQVLGIQVTVDSQEGTGTCFELLVPAAESVQVDAEKPYIGNPLSLTGIHIAFCGGIAGDARENQAMLERWGADVSVWQEVQDAVQSFHAGEIIPNMIVSDDLSYKELLARLAGDSCVDISQLPVLVMSADKPRSGAAKETGKESPKASVVSKIPGDAGKALPHYHLNSALSPGVLRSFVQRSLQFQERKGV
ncbi:MAG: ATP-binding protein [Pseudohongiellaceae bacterium]